MGALDVILEWLLPMILEVLFPKRPTVEVPTIILLNLIINPLPILDDKGPDGIINMLADTFTDKHRLNIDMSWCLTLPHRN